MKLTDFSIIFVITALCFLITIDVRSDIASERIALTNDYNRILDNATEDALRAGYKNVDSKGKPLVDLNEVSSYFFGEIAIMLDGTKLLRDYYRENVCVLIYQDEEGFYCSDDGFKEKRMFSSGSDTVHSDRVYELLSIIRERYGVTLSIPLNDGEAFENTVGEYSLIVIYKNYDGFYTFSGAKITL